MHLPYVQVTRDLIRHAPDLAIIVGVSEAQVGWGLVRLIDWAISRCPEDRPPSASAIVEGPAAEKLIARAAGFSGAAGDAFIRACLEFRPDPILERVPEGIRIRGLRRYDHYWSKNHPRLASEWRGKQSRNRHETGPISAANRSGFGAPDTDTDTDTEKNSEASASAGDGQASLLVAPTRDPVTELREAWNELTAPPIPRWTRGRERAARRALERRPLAQWREVFARIQASAFCRGERPGSQWVANIDWALRDEGNKPETATLVLEGTYDDPATRRADPPAEREPCQACGERESELRTWADVRLCYPCGAAWHQAVPEGLPLEEMPEWTRRWAAERRQECAA